MPGKMYFEVEVTALVAEDELDDEDLDVAGVYDFMFDESEVRDLDADKIAEGYEPGDKYREHVLDLFHWDCAIHMLDNFEITVTDVTDQVLKAQAAKP